MIPCVSGTKDCTGYDMCLFVNAVYDWSEVTKRNSCVDFNVTGEWISSCSLVQMYAAVFDVTVTCTWATIEAGVHMHCCSLLALVTHTGPVVVVSITYTPIPHVQTDIDRFGSVGHRVALVLIGPTTSFPGRSTSVLYSLLMIARPAAGLSVSFRWQRRFRQTSQWHIVEV